MRLNEIYKVNYNTGIYTGKIKIMICNKYETKKINIELENKITTDGRALVTWEQNNRCKKSTLSRIVQTKRQGTYI